jgi:hypothetical protein
MARSIRLLRAFDPYRLGIIDAVAIPPSLIQTQQELRSYLATWHHALSNIPKQQASPDETETYHILKMRWLVCKIWTDSALCRDETSWDSYREDFGHIVWLAREAISSRDTCGADRTPVFTFEMGFSPLLHFVVLKCRFLPLRLEASTLLKELGFRRESVWDAALMYAIGERIIEREHGVKLASGLVEKLLLGTTAQHTLPSEEQRIRDSVLEEETRVDCGVQGSTTIRRKICFFLCTKDGMGVRLDEDWISLPKQS